jgi:DNA-directed RNA polymerase specialized sigma24 family protein
MEKAAPGDGDSSPHVDLVVESLIEEIFRTLRLEVSGKDDGLFKQVERKSSLAVEKLIAQERGDLRGTVSRRSIQELVRRVVLEETQSLVCSSMKEIYDCLHSFARSNGLVDAEEVEDFSQAVLLRMADISRTHSRYSPSPPLPKKLLKTFGRNVMRELRRASNAKKRGRRIRHVSIFEDGYEPTGNAETSGFVGSPEDGIALKLNLGLEEIEWSILFDRYGVGLPRSEIAEQHGLTVQQVKDILEAAKAKARKSVEGRSRERI